MTIDPTTQTETGDRLLRIKMLEIAIKHPTAADTVLLAKQMLEFVKATEAVK